MKHSLVGPFIVAIVLPLGVSAQPVEDALVEMLTRCRAVVETGAHLDSAGLHHAQEPATLFEAPSDQTIWQHDTAPLQMICEPLPHGGVIAATGPTDAATLARMEQSVTQAFAQLVAAGSHDGIRTLRDDDEPDFAGISITTEVGAPPTCPTNIAFAVDTSTRDFMLFLTPQPFCNIGSIQITK